MMGNNQNICVLTKNGKPRRIKRKEADKLVNRKEAKFISKTEYLTLKHKIKIPQKVLEGGDRAVKNFIKTKLQNRKEQRCKDERKKQEQSGETDQVRDDRKRKKNRQKKTKSHSQRKRSDYKD